MEQLMMMSNKSGKKAIGKNCAADSNNLFISWNKDDNMYIPIKLKIPVKNKNLSSKKIKITSFPLLEDSQKKKKLIVLLNCYLKKKMQY